MPQSVQTLIRLEKIPYDTPVDLSIGQCKECGLIQQVGQSLIPAYEDEDYCWSISFSPQAQKNLSGLAKRLFDDYALSERKVLEVGGGDGYFAHLLQSLGCQVTLIDPAPQSCKIARNRGLTKVIQGDLVSGLFPSKQFDVVIIRHVLEHVPNPVDFLLLVREYIRTDGILIVEVPNTDSTLACGRFQDFCMEHLSYFSPSTLAHVFLLSKFNIIETFTIEKGESLVCICRKTDSELRKMANELKTFRQGVRDLIREATEAGRRVGIFGAGTRGVPLLAMINAADLEIAYVVDSDTKKWDRFTPITHLPIVSPEHLANDPVDDLLISTTAYQNEIIQQLDWFLIPGRRFGLLEPQPHWIDAVCLTENTEDSKNIIRGEYPE